MNRIEITVGADSDIRLDVYLTHQLKEDSRTKIQDWIQDERVRVDGRLCRPSYHVQTGERITVDPRPVPAGSDSPKPEDIPLDIIYEDDVLAVINKPAGLVVHPGAGRPQGTLVNALVYKFAELSTFNSSLRPGIVHRLDKDTSGLILIAKNDQTHTALARQFQRREVRKVYGGITWGNWDTDQGTIKAAIGRKRNDPTCFIVKENGKESITDYSVQEMMRYHSFVNFYPRTGRTHQIRVHSTYLGHPIFGDEKYGGGASRLKGYLPEVTRQFRSLLLGLGRQALHALEIEFEHPVNRKRVTFQAPLPKEFMTCLENLRKHYA